MKVYKTILKNIILIFSWTLSVIICLMVIFALTCTVLYYRADMKVPDITSERVTDTLAVEESFFRFGGNMLRKSESGLYEMRISGKDFERGVAIGALTKDLLYYQEKVFVDQIRRMVPSEGYLKFLEIFTKIFNRNLGENVTEELRREILGISLSCTDEFNAIGTPYERQLNYHSAHDLGHAMQDYMLVGCSSFAVWGDRSTDWSLVIGRNFDFYMGEDFAKNKIVYICRPERGYNFLSVTWAGMIGVLSGMNETGLTVTINAAKSSMPTSTATPISLLTREILQYASTIEEAYEIASKRKTFVAESILIGSAKDGRAAVIEKSPDAIALYEVPEEEEYLVCTNHYQSEYFMKDAANLENIATSDSKYREERLRELIVKKSPVDEHDAASILRDRRGLAGKNIGLTNEKAINQMIAHHSVIFKPEEKIVWVSTSPWQLGKYVAYDLNEIFSDSLDFSKEIYTAEIEIPEDPFLKSQGYENLLAFVSLSGKIRSFESSKQSVLSHETIEAYIASNPNFYGTYELLGDYYLLIEDRKSAVEQWKKALQLELPRLADKQKLEKKIRKNAK